jgi:hypothetical protein
VYLTNAHMCNDIEVPDGRAAHDRRDDRAEDRSRFAPSAVDGLILERRPSGFFGTDRKCFARFLALDPHAVIVPCAAGEGRISFVWGPFRARHEKVVPGLSCGAVLEGRIRAFARCLRAWKPSSFCATALNLLGGLGGSIFDELARRLSATS